MEEIKKIISEFLKAEAEASDASVKPNLEDYNKKLNFMNSFCVEELHNKFGLVSQNKLKNDEFYERWKDKNSARTRHIYKISQYKDDKYGDVYVAYVSERNPDDEIFLYGECLFVTSIDSELKIIKNYTFGEDRGKDKFVANQGLKDISFKTLKKPINIERYLEPVDDEDGMEHYSKDI
ncbi:hypothetical protein OF897_16995 [Chryseobacterium formosus]|uniref:Uncharacterized protein n=1 Tax=Chryseobacterium formosus TaxID=1537363 RepID=A0ABT3XVA1_9FLAO|nr:hypothetical protein [Chryseobacterium formosus]MCX8525613.1 hypothetical protein [Chryseobacterium formosus]